LIFVKYIFLGIVQGLTEFLPISSSGHLYILKEYLAIGQKLLPFFILLHFATLLAICVFFNKEIRKSFSKKRILVNIGLITLITMSIGFLIDVFLKGIFEGKYFVLFCFLISGSLLISIKVKNQNRSLDDLRLKDSLFLGILQGFAILPGISRSGITIFGLLRRGFRPKEAFNLSFLMALPVILSVTVIKFKNLCSLNIPIVGIVGGFLSAFLFGLSSIFIVKKSIMHNFFDKFGYYCIMVAFLILLL